ncbi:MAG: restriction endonuclease subunit S, partial [Aeriscardovia sp.]|nr:restriction endonuclease subunit S [Aeriscardovia sp.]
QPGDIVYNMMRAWQGAFGAARVEGMVSPAYVTARPIVEMDSRYFEYLMRSDTAAQEFEKYSRGIADFRLRLYWPEFKNIKVCYPPVSEQSEIADFLDNIYKKVDEAKAYHSSLINKLEEYRNSVTYNLVTGKMECEEVQNG